MLNIYKASAGSGKTFTLAREYIKMLLGVENRDMGTWSLNRALLTGRHSIGHRHILAITFTNKATEEMKTRIIANLAGLTHIHTLDDHPYAKSLTSVLGCTIDELSTAARNAMTSLLLDFSFFNVSTIDSFFQSVLRTFARELDIQGDYNIRIETDEAIRDAFNMLLDALNTMSHDTTDSLELRVREWLNKFVDERTGKDVKFSPFQRNSSIYNDRIKVVKDIFTEQFKPLQADLREYLADPANLERFRAETERVMAEQATAVTTAVDTLLAAVDSLGFSDNLSKNFVNAIEKVRSGEIFDKLAKGIKDLPVSFNLAVTGNLDRASNSTYTKGFKVSDWPTELSCAFEQWANDTSRAMTRWLTARELNENIPSLEFIGLMMSYLDRLRESDNMLILDDSSSYIKRIIGGSSVPFIYEHIGTEYRNFLIDEFQDTSRLQWENIKPLIDNSHADNDDSLIIGDTKQAIYRFRNSDATILGNDLTAKDFPHPDEHRVKGNTPEDNTNWRTAHPIVKLNNAIFPLFASEAFGVQMPIDGYTPADVVQQCSAKTAGLPARVRFFPFDMSMKGAYKTGEDVVAGSVATVPTDADKFSDVDILDRFEPLPGTLRVECIVSQIKAQHDLHGYRWGEIAILSRFNKSADPVVKALLKNDIPVQSAESLFLKNAPSVRLILGILRLIARAGTPDAPINRASADNPKTRAEARMELALFESRFDYFLHAKGYAPAEAINSALNPNDGDGAPVNASINDTIRTILDNHPSTLVAIIESILVNKLVPYSIVEKEKDYVAAFEDLALSYSEEHDNNLNGFLAWWDAHGDRQTVTPPPDADAVVVMSVHRAKGLEFKCVHVIDFEWEFTSKNEKIWLDVRPGSDTNTCDVALDLDIDPATLPPLTLFRIAFHHSDLPFSPYRGIVAEQRRKMILDAINIAYVALTRPVSELSVYFACSDAGKSKGTDHGEALPTVVETVADALVRSLDHLVAVGNGDSLTLTVDRNIYNPVTGALALDVAADDKEASSKVESPDVKDDRFVEVDYLGKYLSTNRGDVNTLVRVDALETADDGEAEADIDDSDADDSDTDDEKRLFARYAEATRRGVDLHRILEGIRVPEDFDTALAVASQSPGFDTEAIEAYASTLRKALVPRIVDRWFNDADDISTETSFFIPANDVEAGGEERIKRIDRLVVHPNGEVDVVDYKFTTEQTKEHRAQVERYVRCVQRIMPDARVRGFLWYVDLARVLEC